ncbi:hypothetical protein V8C26DRAFT_435461 [Trichoderma gracile]
MASSKNPRKPQNENKAKKTSRTGKRKNHDSKNRKSTSKTERELAREKQRETTQKQRQEQILLGKAGLHHGLELELPEEPDFANYYSAVPQMGHYLNIRKLRQDIKKEDDDPPQPQSHMAPAPWVPSPYDDAFPKRPYWAGDDHEEGDEQEESQGRPRKRACTRSNASAKRQRCNAKPSPLSQEFILAEDESDEEEPQIPEHIIRKTPPTFMGIPTEIRLQIYRDLLIAEQPIQVFGGWKQLYWKEDLRLSTGILRVCKAVYEEACTVLYGANTFLYLLRDPSSEMDDLDDLATDDSPQTAEDYYNDDSDLDYEEEDTKRPVRPPKERTINIAKYAHLFRKLNIKAEANRYSGVTLEGMAAAVNVFARKVAPDGTGWDKSSSSCFIRTLTVSVSPTSSNQQGSSSSSNNKSQEPNFTFVNFFVPGSPVLAAIKAVDCRLLRIDILTSETKRGKTCSMSGTGSCRLEFNRFYERYCADDGGTQIGFGDGENRFARRRAMKMAKMAKLSEKRIDELAEHVALFCKQRGFGQRTTEGMDVDSPYWNDFEDEDVDEDDF